ncbi:hypothetical protein PUN28_017576 [Cardiocondyla obscurior]|uniref:Uncharacterized protein n=1 Tax=Cardiocondyla obscurior TaxID=286306 RepID=A0AAW2EKD8_9HYME
MVGTLARHVCSSSGRPLKRLPTLRHHVDRRHYHVDHYHEDGTERRVSSRRPRDFVKYSSSLDTSHVARFSLLFLFFYFFFFYFYVFRFCLVFI